MQSGCIVPPDCCVIIEVEDGVRLGYRKAVLLDEINALGSLEKAAKVSRIPLTHAWQLVKQMNRDFSSPLVIFTGQHPDDDLVTLTERGNEVTKNYWRRFQPAWLEIQEERSLCY